MFLTIKNTAILLQVSTRTIYNYIDDGLLEVIKIQREWKKNPTVRITQESVNKLIDNSKFEGKNKE
jgi:predicted site-specific integrase-resolvase